MKFRSKDVIIGFLLIASILVGGFFYKKLKTPKVLPTPVPENVKSKIKEIFNYTIPEDVNSIELKDLTGGNAKGLATINEILVDIEDPKEGYFYQGWLEKDGQFVSLGKMRMAKGGWLLEYDGTKYPDYKKVIVSLEKKFDLNLETKILEGSF